MANGFSGIADIVDADSNGQRLYTTWRKSPSQVNATGLWFDTSSSPGNPNPQYYASTPLQSVALRQSTDGGLFHGGNVSPKKKVVRSTTLMVSNTAGALPIMAYMLDYVLYYPFINMNTTATQTLTNSVTLPRHTTGAGLKIMAVMQAGGVGGQSFSVSYTNQDGTSGRTTETAIINTNAAVGNIISSSVASATAPGPFLTLQGKDTGVRSIQSITMTGPDVGLFALVLVKPLVTTQLLGIDAPVFVDYLRSQNIAPQIVDDAYLNWIFNAQGTAAITNMHGDLLIEWN